jgi:phosphoribosylformylglycinamidine synthase
MFYSAWDGPQMKAKVYVNLKAGVLDPQGKAIQHSVELLGFSGIEDVRQGKYFEISLDDSVDSQRARESVEKMAREVLSNPIIEDYRVEIEA